MSIRTTPKDAERRAVPSLQIMPKLEPGRHADGVSLRMLPGRWRRAGLIALLAAAAAAAAIFVVLDRAHSAPVRTSASVGGHLGGLLPSYAASDDVMARSGSRMALAGLRTASHSLSSAAAAGAAAADRSTAVVPGGAGSARSERKRSDEPR